MVTADNTIGSIGCTPKSCVSIARRIAKAPAKPHDDAEPQQREPFRDDEPEDAPAVAAEREADADFLAPLRHLVGEHAVDPDRREEQRVMPPKSDASSIGARRFTSDSSTRCCIGLTEKNGSSGSISRTCARMLPAIADGSPTVRAAITM